jgi:hypothetical protein
VIEKFVVYNKDTKEYFKRGYGLTTEQKRARLYSRRGDAVNSLRRKWLDGFDVYPVNMDLTVKMGAKGFDIFEALWGVTPTPFEVVVKYFREMYEIDVAGTQPEKYPMCVDMVEVFVRNMKSLKGWHTGDNFMITSNTCENERPLPQMLAEEMIRMFGYETQGRRVAVFQVDWLDENGRQTDGY